MIFQNDTQELDNPNEFGELLREHCFEDTPCPTITGFHKPYGCYSTFDLKDGFEKLSGDNKIYKRLEKLSGILNGDGRAYFHAYSNGQIHLGWWWDGDGTLIIQEGNKIAINNDCKSSYGWAWIVEE